MGLPMTVDCTVTNIGARMGDEVVMVFHKAGDSVRTQAKHPVPQRALIGFDRVAIRMGGKAPLKFIISEKDVSLIDEKGQPHLYSGAHTLIFSRGHGAEVSIE